MSNEVNKKLPKRERRIDKDLLKNEILEELLAEIFPSHMTLTPEKKTNLLLSLRDIPAIRLNIKNFGYNLGIQFSQTLNNANFVDKPERYDLVSKPSTQEDIESTWFSYWCNQLKVTPLYHRKLWELAFTLQSFLDFGVLIEGKNGIGFGCGEEPLASYFASRKINVTVTDLSPDRTENAGWSKTGQHASTLEKAHHSNLVNLEEFKKYATHKFIDMNNIPKLDSRYDFCWSICALEHLGSIEKGLQFIENSLEVLKPGGFAVHTTEFNYLSENETIDDYPIVLFLKKHFIELANRLKEKGHRMLGPSFDIGDHILDRFIDLPPYTPSGEYYDHDGTINKYQGAHLKLSLDGFPCTCYGISIVKNPN